LDPPREFFKVNKRPWERFRLRLPDRATFQIGTVWKNLRRRDQILALFELADRKGYDVTQSTMRDHVRLIDGEGNLVKNKTGGAVFSYAEARRFLEALPERKN